MNENREQIAENRIIILYILNELALPITNLQLTDILASRTFMDYFSQQEIFSELLEFSLIKELTDETERKFYVITNEGKSALAALPELIPPPIKQNFDSNKKLIKEMIKRDWEINATQHIDENDNHFVRLFVRDGDTFLVDMKILAGSKKLASEMCVNWRKNTEKVYSELINNLLK